MATGKEPVDKFRSYLRDNADSVKWSVTKLGYDLTRVKVELCKMIEWLTYTDGMSIPQQRDRQKRDWHKFLFNWLKRASGEEDLTAPTTIEEAHKVTCQWNRVWAGGPKLGGGMTEKEETEHYRAKARVAGDGALPDSHQGKTVMEVVTELILREAFEKLTMYNTRDEGVKDEEASVDEE